MREAEVVHDPTEGADEEVLSQSGSRSLVIALVICALIAGGIALWRVSSGGGEKHAAVAPTSAAPRPSTAAPQPTFTSEADAVVGRSVSLSSITDAITDHYPGAHIRLFRIATGSGQVTQVSARVGSARITVTLRPQRATDVLETDEADVGAHPSVDVSVPHGRVLVHVHVVGTAAHPPAIRPAEKLADDDRLLRT